MSEVCARLLFHFKSDKTLYYSKRG